MLDDLLALMTPEAPPRPRPRLVQPVVRPEAPAPAEPLDEPGPLSEPDVAPAAPGQAVFFAELEEGRVRAGLQDRFGVPPFSVLDARAGYWQARKAEWLAMGIESELGRGAKAYNDDGTPTDGMAPGGSLMPAARVVDGKIVRGDSRAGVIEEGLPSAKGLLSKATEREGFGLTYDTSKGENAWGGSGTSIFDPVICELAYRWFTPRPDSAVLDPFAGGSVRGIVASVLGHRYTGVDLSARQLEANRGQAVRLVPGHEPEWIVGDSRQLERLLPAGQQYDLIFSCPPYYDLEVYSDDPAELSAAGSYDAFLAMYGDCIRASLARLRPERFVVWVVGEIRDKRGMQRGLVTDTIALFREAGAALYNEAVLVTAVGSLPLRAGKAFVAGRKLGRTHQAVLVFWKGRRSPNEAFPRLEQAETAETLKALEASA